MASSDKIYGDKEKDTRGKEEESMGVYELFCREKIEKTGKKRERDEPEKKALLHSNHAKTSFGILRKFCEDRKKNNEFKSKEQMNNVDREKNQ